MILEFEKIGHSKKPFGKNGWMRLHVEDIYTEDVLNARALFFNINGSEVPYLIQKIQNHGHWEIKLDEVDTPELAGDLSNKNISLELSEVSQKAQETSQSNELLGFQVYDKNKPIGEVIDIDEYPGQFMLKVSKIEGTECLIPLQESWLQAIDSDSKKIYMDLPDGLIEL